MQVISLDSDSFYFIAFTLNNSSHNSSKVRELNIKKILLLNKSNKNIYKVYN